MMDQDRSTDELLLSLRMQLERAEARCAELEVERDLYLGMLQGVKQDNEPICSLPYGPTCQVENDFEGFGENDT